ncbi:MAG: 4-(cytidine 5'-diphospho)-2-C-methyl-D-erythritol kinase, partial [Acidobacteriaceae bacterium]
MSTRVRSFAKINLGLTLGPVRADGFHDLRTCYHSIAAHDVITVERRSRAGIEVCARGAPGAMVGDELAAEFARRVPCDETNTCYRIAEKLLQRARQPAGLLISIEKGVPVQGGLGAASSNAAATLLAAERELGIDLPPRERYALCVATGSDVPQFLLGGWSLGMGRGEQVFPLPEIAALPLVVVAPRIGVSTAQAFSDWDALLREDGLTAEQQSLRLDMFSQSLYSWLNGIHTGVSAEAKSGNRAEAPLLDLVRTGAVNDFERVVFPLHPELRESKLSLERAGAVFASLSGSGSTLYGLFASTSAAQDAARQLTRQGLRAFATSTLPRREY